MASIQQRRQIKVTRTIALIIVSDFVLDVIPWTIQIAVTKWMSMELKNIIAQSLWVFNQLNRNVNLGICLWKLKEIRRAVLRLLLCKKFPQNQIIAAPIGG